MGSKERIAREKNEIRNKILKASLDIIIAEGCLALSMRKIADRIEYATSTIYEYFANKDAILIALMSNGYDALGKELRKVQKKKLEPKAELLTMWQSYWNYAFKNEELYKLMFGIQISCPKPVGEIDYIKEPEDLFVETILKTNNGLSEEKAIINYIGMWSLVHGLISINMVTQPLEKVVNTEILTTSINTFINQ